jgi:hypothetical protein
MDLDLDSTHKVSKGMSLDKEFIKPAIVYAEASGSVLFEHKQDR